MNVTGRCVESLNGTLQAPTGDFRPQLNTSSSGTAGMLDLGLAWPNSSSGDIQQNPFDHHTNAKPIPFPSRKIQTPTPVPPEMLEANPSDRRINSLVCNGIQSRPRWYVGIKAARTTFCHVVELFSRAPPPSRSIPPSSPFSLLPPLPPVSLSIVLRTTTYRDVRHKRIETQQ